jgi:gas vesicle protein
MKNDRIYYSHEAEMYMKRDRTLLAMLFLTFGLGIGATIALLFAPTSGKITRQELTNNIEDRVQAGREAVDPMVKRVEKKFDEVKESVNDHRKQPS